MPELIIKSLVSLYDDQDKDLIASRKWNIRNGWGDTPYVISGTGILHRLIMDCPKGLLVDHKNHNTLDNRRENLRIVTRSQNMWNRKKTCGLSKYKGVSLVRATGKWQALLRRGEEYHYLGCYKTQDEAGHAYNVKAQELFGEFACLNEVQL